MVSESLDPRRMLVIGAHSADFVWRAGGALAVTTSTGGVGRVIALSYGEKGESGELWKDSDPAHPQTIDNVKTIRHGEAERAAGHLGADFRCLDLGDYPLQIDTDALERISDEIREFAPDVLITHTDTDPFNPDHPVANTAVGRARSLAAGAGVQSSFKTVRPPEFFLFEPHQPELCNFTPTTFVDITAVMDAKRAAMAEMKSQKYLHTYYAERAEHRGNHARRSSGNQDIRQAEAFQRVTPQVVSSL
jgi:4-oxalomesaconate hydratase